jgi:hypothetical protein
MLLDIFVTAPLLLMTNLAWYIHIGLVLMCLIVLFVAAVGAVSFIHKVRGDGHPVPRIQRPEPLPQP